MTGGHCAPPRTEDLFHCDEGAGEAVLCLHSMAGSARMWDSFSRAAVEQGLRAIRFDARQHGRSAGIGGFTIERNVLDAIELLNRLDVQRCHVVGISMGGQTAMRLALLQPERVCSLVLANTSAGGNPGGSERVRKIQAQIEEMGYPAFAADYVASRMANGRDSPRYADYLVDALLAGPQGYMACLRSIVAQDLHGALSCIHQPALLIAASADTSTPLPMMQRLQDRLPHSRLIEIEGAAHFSCLDAPRRFEALALRFLARPSEATPTGA